MKAMERSKYQLIGEITDMFIQLVTNHNMIAAFAKSKHIPEYVHRHSNRISKVKKCDKIAANGSCVTFGLRERNSRWRPECCSSLEAVKSSRKVQCIVGGASGCRCRYESENSQIVWLTDSQDGEKNRFEPESLAADGVSLLDAKLGAEEPRKGSCHQTQTTYQ